MPPEEAAQNFAAQLLAPSPPRFAAPEPGAASSYAAIAAQTNRAGFSQPSAATEDYPAAESAKRGVPDGDLRENLTKRRDELHSALDRLDHQLLFGGGS